MISVGRNAGERRDERKADDFKIFARSVLHFDERMNKATYAYICPFSYLHGERSITILGGVCQFPYLVRSPAIVRNLVPMFATTPLNRPSLDTNVRSNPLLAAPYTGIPLRKDHGSLPAPQSAPQSMREVLMRPLNHIDSLSQALLRSLAPSQSNAAKPPSAPSITAFMEVDQALATAVNMAQVHQEKQREIEALTKEILDLERELRDRVQFLADGRNTLNEILRESEETIAAIDLASKSTSISS